ncbi:unnamed protein product [Owenia fusiformis]|uniref:Uncharacterized protein n=1 Tax=Owenia fusiformis TaxID=6347 RepID=A0A8J1XLN8_OWEFU|nr:unnamed protein product [Owenia fusiformis]
MDQIFVLKSVKQSLERVLVGTTEPSVGFLLGQEHRDGIQIVGCCRCTKPLIDEIEEVSLYYPGGIKVYGIFYSSATPPGGENVNKACSKLLHQDLVDKIDSESILLCHSKMNTERVSTDSFYWYSIEERTPKLAEVEWRDEPKETITLRLQANIPLAFEYMLSNRAFEDFVSQFLELQDKIRSDVTAFHIDDTNILLYDKPPKESSIIAITDDTACEKLYDYIQTEDDENTSKKHRNKSVIKVSLLTAVTGYQAVGRTIDCSPIIHHEHSDFENISSDLPLDVLVCVDPNMPVGNLAKLFVGSVCHQLVAMEKCLFHFHKEDKEFLVPQPHHFKPAGLDHFITTLYPQGLSEKRLEPVRRTLNQKFSLSLDVPLFRRMNAYNFPEDNDTAGYLHNVHVGLPPSGVKEGTQYLVQGRYSYHHYMQDRFDDNHWGCAYRSLQTVVSWFRLQGYTDQPVPTHRAIQQALVDIKDKEASFVGSRKWIGSMEVSYVLDRLLEVQCKIMFVQSGADLANKGRELAMHFSIQGTPIMIGGGVLAHTILGVDFNDITGDLKFLILDPHYTGAEDLKIIQDKGWCGWKDTSFWDKNAYYNLCLPQRPKMI